ncbi:ORF6N domain-containing protein [Caedibacter taeniospiralis]|uniref:ORF6N domain-containing protein n=1 Tax=Caedibacter taeniospiralis TaxID=28907 RepID=UPI0037BF4474
MDAIKIESIEDLILEVQGQKVLLDRDVANVYGVETKRINEAVRNNPDRFPDGYILEVEEKIKKELVENFDRFKTLKHATVNPKAFTEKGIYMLATVLTSKKAIQTTIEIIETFSKIRELSRNVKKLSAISDKKEQQRIMQKSGELIAEILDDDLQTSEAETTIQLNFAVLKFKHTIRKKKHE